MGCCCSSSRDQADSSTALGQPLLDAPNARSYDAFLPSAQLAEAFTAKYKLVSLLGNGHIAKCYSCRLVEDESAVYAAKIVNKRQVGEAPRLFCILCSNATAHVFWPA